METKSIEQEHAEMVQDLLKDPNAILNGLTPGSVNKIHSVLGLAGEVGELIDAIKKHTMYTQSIDYNNVVEELGDIEFYLYSLRESCYITREQTLRANIHKLRKRYAKGYSDAAAKERADKVEKGCGD